MNREDQRTMALSTEVRGVRKKEGPITTAFKEGCRRRAEKNGEVVFDLVFGAFACFFAMTHAAFGVYPFSLALLFAAGSRMIPILIGGAVGCTFLGDAGVLYLILHILAFLYRLAVSYPRARKHLPESYALFAEAPSLRAVGAALLGLLMALYELILFGVESYTLLFAAGACLLLPLSSILFSFVTAQGWSVRTFLGKVAPPTPIYFGKHAPFLLSLGGVFLFFVCALSLLPYSFFGISLGKCAIVAFTLLISRRYGAARGCAAGLLIGLAGETVYLPAFGILGLLSGLYGGIGMPLSLAGAVLAASGYAAYVGGLSGFLAVIPEMAVVSLVLWVPLRYLSPDSEKYFKLSFSSPMPAPPEKKAEERSIASLSGALSKVSEHLKEAAEQEMSPSPEEFEALCASVRERICRRCPADGSCKENEAVKESLRATVIRLSIGEGVVSAGASPCEGHGKMIEEIRREAARLRQRKRMGGAKGALSADYALFSEMLTEIGSAEEEGVRDRESEAALTEALASYDILADEVAVYGKRKKRLILRALRGENGRTVESEWVEEACVRVCGRSVSGLRFSYEDGNLCAFAESHRIFSAEGGSYTLAGKEGECAADSAATLENDSGFVYALLCDGMGSGSRAASAASLSISVLSSLLSADVSRGVALAALNNAICTSEEECSVALDLLSLDLYEGRAGFLKSGAAASFVFRDGTLFRIRSRTLPLGLLRIVDSEEAGFDVRAGDVMVLLSDGVLGESEDGSWLKEILSRGGESTSLARRIVESAAERAASEDDKTALVLKVNAKENEKRAPLK